MTDKQRVKDFITFLQEHPDTIMIGKNESYTYSSLRESIIKTLQMSHSDGYEQGKLDTEANALYDVTIGGHKDW